MTLLLSLTLDVLARDEDRVRWGRSRRDAQRNPACCRPSWAIALGQDVPTQDETTDMSDHDIDYSSRLKDAGIICATAIDALVRDLQRRRSERLEEQPDNEPCVTMAWVLDELVKARNLGVKLDNWLDLKTIAGISKCSKETARRRWHEAPEEVRRRNGVNGKFELHVEYVAELLDETVEEVKEQCDELKEAA